MPLEVPKTDKVYTTTYENFKGVDFTNDATNIYKRRSPSGSNMMPDLDGKPYKRKGWEVAIDDMDFAIALGLVDEGVAGMADDEETEEAEETKVNYLGEGFEIYRCHYFELAGSDHIMIFSSAGLFAYRAGTSDGDNADELVFLSDDMTLRNSYDRAYYFDADGETGFYMYGNFKTWKYHYDEEHREFKLEEVAPTIPCIRFSVSANGKSAETLDSPNLFTSMVAEEFQSNLAPRVSAHSSNIDVDGNVFVLSNSGAGEYKYTYKDGTWTDANGIGVTVATLGITLNVTPTNGTEVTVTVVNDYMTYLFYEVPLENASRVTVKATAEDEKYSKVIEVITGGQPSADQARLETVEEDEKRRTRLIYGAPFMPPVSGQDVIRVEYPSVTVTTTTHYNPPQDSATPYYVVPVKVGGES